MTLRRLGLAVAVGPGSASRCCFLIDTCPAPPSELSALAPTLPLWLQARSRNLFSGLREQTLNLHTELSPASCLNLGGRRQVVATSLICSGWYHKLGSSWFRLPSIWEERCEAMLLAVLPDPTPPHGVWGCNSVMEHLPRRPWIPCPLSQGKKELTSAFLAHECVLMSWWPFL